MYKKVLCLLSLLMLASCYSSQRGDSEFVYYCPNVSIVPFHNRVTKMSDNGVIYKAELIGYEGYCRSFRGNQTNAVIEPIFEITRLSPTYNGEVSIRYYADTTENEVPLMGKQFHTLTAEIPNLGEKTLYKGKEIMVKIPNEKPGYKIKLGIALTKAEYTENLKLGLGTK